MKKPKLKFQTLAIKSTESTFSNSEPVSTPIYLSSTYKRNADGSYNNDLVYSRNDNPNRNIVETSIAKLEKGSYGLAFSSGLAAISAVFQLLKAGDHIILPDDAYYAVKKLMNTVLKRWELSYSLVDMTNLAEVKSVVQKNTRLIWLESPSNPQLKISDIKAIAEIAKKNNMLTVVDNTWLTPVLQNPIKLGADIVVHSSTKYFGGHSDVVGGCVVLNNTELAESLKAIQTLSGAVPSPFDCWLIARGVQTLHLRVSKQTKNAIKLAKYFENHPKISQVNYPGLKSHPQHKLAKKQQNNGFGAMISILLDMSENESFNLITRLKLFTSATSLGGVESLVEHRKSVEGVTSTTPGNLIRISVGIEHIDDLIVDWEQALTS
jgi:cystathionine gamma-synthase